jgi:hypothetical protein
MLALRSTYRNLALLLCSSILFFTTYRLVLQIINTIYTNTQIQYTQICHKILIILPLNLSDLTNFTDDFTTFPNVFVILAY